MSSPESFIDQVNEYVDRLECNHLANLLGWETQAVEKAEKCGCQNCQNEAMSARMALDSELERLVPINPELADHEEEHLTDWIISNKLTRGYEEGDYEDYDDGYDDRHDDDLYGRIS